MNKEINGELITLAREYRGVTQTHVSKAASIGQGTLAKLEGGLLTAVSDDLVARIAHALKFPVSFFYLNEERVGFGSSSYYYRKKSRVSAADRKYITGVVNLYRISLNTFLKSVDMNAERELPTYEIDDFEGDAAEIARALRAAWGVPDGPIKNVTRLLENAGVIVVPCDLKTKHMDATSIHLTNSPPMVFANTYSSGDRLRFTLAHELGHLVMHMRSAPYEEMEDEADAFAAEFLAPQIEIRAQLRRLGKIRIADLLGLKPYWKISVASLLVRAGQMGLLTESQKRYLWTEMSRLGYRTKEPVEIPREEPANFSGLVDHIINNLGYSAEDLADSVSLNIDDLYVLYRDCLPKRPEATRLRVVK